MRAILKLYLPPGTIPFGEMDYKIAQTKVGVSTALTLDADDLFVQILEASGSDPSNLILAELTLINGGFQANCDELTEPVADALARLFPANAIHLIVTPVRQSQEFYILRVKITLSNGGVLVIVDPSASGLQQPSWVVLFQGSARSIVPNNRLVLPSNVTFGTFMHTLKRALKMKDAHQDERRIAQGVTAAIKAYGD